MRARQLMMTAIYGDDWESMRATWFICDRTEGKVR
jgi:hypothetical protein